MKGVLIYTLQSLAMTAATTSTKDHEGLWIPARPMGFTQIRYRLRAAWLVFTGRADAVTWPGGQ